MLDPRIERTINRVILGALLAIVGLDIVIRPHVPVAWHKPVLFAFLGAALVGASSLLATMYFGRIIPAKPRETRVL